MGGIIDTQIHIGPGKIEETLAAMDALGIQSALIDEYWLSDMFAYHPNHPLENGAIRPVCPTAELASQMYPERFSWVLRVDKDDPEFAAIIRMIKTSPAGRGIRLIPGMTPQGVKDFSEGAYDHLLAAAAENDLPVFLHLPDHPEAIGERARKFPSLRIIVDHCGLFHNHMRAMYGKDAITLSDEEQLALYDRVLRLSEFDNIALKWAHASTMFNIPAFPGEKLRPILRDTIRHFSADRIMWASDFSVNQRGESWSELLYGMKCNTDLTEQEASAILGDTARTWLNWK